MKSCAIRTAVAATLGLVLPAFAAPRPFPDTPQRPVVDTYHGFAVTDDYRWLEDDNAPDVKRWIAGQNSFTRRYLDAIPQRPGIAKRVASLYRSAPIQRYSFEYRLALFAL
jgi:prolyl oligopeptidase